MVYSLTFQLTDLHHHQHTIHVGHLSLAPCTIWPTNLAMILLRWHHPAPSSIESTISPTRVPPSKFRWANFDPHRLTTYNELGIRQRTSDLPHPWTFVPVATFTSLEDSTSVDRKGETGSWIAESSVGFLLGSCRLLLPQDPGGKNLPTLLAVLPMSNRGTFSRRRHPKK